MNDKHLSNKIDQYIEHLSHVANDLPGVVIIHDIRDWSVVWMSEKGLKELGTTAEELIGKSNEEYHKLYFNQDDAMDYVPRINDLLQRNNNDETLTFFQQVRLSDHKDWKWHVSSIKIALRDEAKAPLLTITISFPIDAMHHMTAKASRLLEENNFLRNNFHHYAKLTRREKEVLRLLALGKSAAETAEALFIASNTVETHRKNIRQKLDSNSYYELSLYARAFDLI